MPTISLVIVDLDNTLYDWVGFYIPSFLAMVEEMSRITRIEPDSLKESFKKVHERHRSTEYAFAIEELDVLRERYGPISTKEAFVKYGSAIEAFRTVRESTLTLYDGVREALAQIKSRRCKLVALTDATFYYGVKRLKELQIEGYFDMICAPADHGLPQGVSISEARRFSDPSRYQSGIPLQLSLDFAIRKPDPAIVRAILHTLQTLPRNSVLVGDSLTKDILLAQTCGVWDVHAAYGSKVDPRFFEELLKITYWTQSDLAEDSKLREKAISPTFVIRSFPELLSIIDRLESQSD